MSNATDLNTVIREFETVYYELLNCSKWESTEVKKGLRSRMTKIKRRLKKLAPELVNGGTYQIQEAAAALGLSSVNKGAKAKFLLNEQVNAEEQKILDMLFSEGVDTSNCWYDYFNKNRAPFDLKLTEVKVEKENAKSNNIYDMMAAPQKTLYRVEFQLRIPYAQITIYKEFWKDTTLSMRDINSFM